MSSWRNEMEGLEDVNGCVPDEEKLRRGGAQGEDEDDADRMKREERDRKKAEVRKRLEEANRSKKAKKGFLTPERKKKLRKLLMMKAAEDLKQQQVLKEQERQKILQERIIPLPDVDNINDMAQLQKIASQMWEHVGKVEDAKYDLEYQVRQKDFEINELTIAVNDLRGKFVKPTLKKVSKYDSKSLKKKTTSLNDFKVNLKVVKQDKFGLEKLLQPKEGEEERKAEREQHAEPAAAEPAAVPAEAEPEAEAAAE